MSHTRASHLLAALGVVLALTGWCADAAWAGTRHAIVIGSNWGDKDEEHLQYAESDAVRFAEVLTQLGGVSPEDLVLLTGKDADQVTGALTALRARLAAAAQAATGEEGHVLFVYYSGHADSRSIHLGGSRLPFATLRAMAKDVGAEATVFIVDACRSGGITRVKGARPSVPFDLSNEADLDAEGVAVITSSAESEDAQESERLRGGIFTHHFLNGLSGAADTTRDQRVTLSEAYRYAYGQTLSATADAPTLQHPTFELTMRGRQELVLTRLDAARGYARIVFSAPGHYIVFERGDGGQLAAELDAESGTELLLVPGDYLVRRRTDDGVSEGEVDLGLGDEQRLVAANMTPVPFRETVRRGLAQPRSTFSVDLGVETSGPLLPALGPTFAGYLGGQWDFHEVALQVRLRYARGAHDNGVVAESDSLLGADLALLHAFGITRGLAFGLGLRLGADWYRQSFDTSGDAPVRDQVVGRLAPMARLEWAPFEDLLFQLDAGADIYALQARADSSGAGGLRATVVPFVGLGVGWRWP
ncbi:MAG: caspase family protein [Myxococcota bacterium]